MHQSLYKQSISSWDEQTAARMLKNSEMIYYETIKSYNNTIQKTKNHIPCLVMGFRIVTKKDEG